MLDPNPLAFLKLPPELLTWVAHRALHDALQPLHHLIRLAHILSASAFFGAVVVLDVRLLRPRGAVALGPLARQLAPALYGCFAVAVASGLVLFLYDPIRVGSHAYFTPKLALMALGLANARLFHRGGMPAALVADVMTGRARVAGAVSLALWLGVMVCAGLNVEAAPRVPLW